METRAASGGKRIVSSCIPCYTKKQKCNRCQPCNHCTRRRQPGNCVYNHAPGSQLPRIQTKKSQQATSSPHDQDIQFHPTTSQTSSARNLNQDDSNSDQESDSLTGLFGHVEHSGSNILALVEKTNVSEDRSQNGDFDIPAEASTEVHAAISRLPAREVFDRLIQYYIDEVHWMEQVVYVPWFVNQYQSWWTARQPSTIMDLEFTVLFLRLCSYASQFLPSPSLTVDCVRGIALVTIREICQDVSRRLAIVCMRFNGKGSLLRVQHLSILGLELQCEGRLGEFREVLCTAVQVAQRIGLHRGRVSWVHGMHEIDKEIRCRVFCNLYAWDSILSRTLDLPPLLSSSLTSEQLPQSLWTQTHGSDGPIEFSDRVAQAMLARFWRNCAGSQGASYNATMAEGRYEKFCDEYLKHLPHVFALEPDEGWDEHLQKLPLQRQLLHVAIFDSLCHNFRAILFHNESQLRDMARSEQILMAFQRKTLAVAALKTLTSTSKLHELLGRAQTRLSAIIMPTFEAAVVLVRLTMDASFPEEGLGDGYPVRSRHDDPLGAERVRLTRERCLQATQMAFARLRMLGEVNKMAKRAAVTLNRLVTKLPDHGTTTFSVLERR